MKFDFLHIKGKQPGEISVILAGVHGNEVCGIKAIEELLPTLAINNGEVIIGWGNPRAIEKCSRQFQANLNRMFKDKKEILKADRSSFEYDRAQLIKLYLNQASALLDIHACSTPNSRPFIICEKNAREIVQYLPFNLIVSGFDRIQPGGTDYYMNKIGRVGICIECGYGFDVRAVDLAKKSVTAFLQIRGHVDGKKSPRRYRKKRMEIFYMHVTKNNFRVKTKLPDFSKIQSGQIVGYDGDEAIKCDRDCRLLFATNRSKANEEAFILAEDKNLWV